MTECEPVVVDSKAIRAGAHLFFGTRTDRNPSARNLYSFPAWLPGRGNVASICFKGALWSWSLKLHVYSLKAKPSLGGKELVILSNYTENEIGGAIKCLKWGSEKFHGEKKKPYLLHMQKPRFRCLCLILHISPQAIRTESCFHF